MYVLVTFFEDSASIKGFASLEDHDDFENRVNGMTTKAATMSLEYEERYRNVDSFINYYDNFPKTDGLSGTITIMQLLKHFVEITVLPRICCFMYHRKSMKGLLSRRRS